MQRNPILGSHPVVTHKMDENLTIIARVQRMVHWIEIFIVSVYFAHMFHMSFAENGNTKHLLGGWFITIGVWVCAAIGFGLALLLGRVLHRRSGHTSDHGPHKRSVPDDLLSRLDRLPPIPAEVREGLRKVAHLADVDPEMAATRARKLLGWVVRDVYERRVKEPPGTRPLENIIQRLVKDGGFPVRLEPHAQAVRMLGNIGAWRSDGELTGENVRSSLEHLMAILEWYLSSIGSGEPGTTSGQTQVETP